MPGDPPPLPERDRDPADGASHETSAVTPHGVLASASPAEDDFLYHIPMARPVSAEFLRSDNLAEESISPGAARLTAWRAVLQIVLLAVAGAGGLLVGALFSLGLPLADKRWENMISTAGAGLACIVAVFVMVYRAGQRPAAIGWRVNQFGLDVAIGIVGAIGFYMLVILGSLAVVALHPELMDESMQAQRKIQEAIPRTSIPTMVLMMVLVALWEELVFRGFLLTRLQAIFKRWWLTIPVGAVLFALGHGWQGSVAPVVIGGVGLLLGVMFVWRRSLLPAVVFHATFNTIGLLLMRAQGTWQ